jgi:hypothetical protein
MTAPVMDALVIVLRQNLPSDQYETMLAFKCQLIKLWRKEKVKLIGNSYFIVSHSILEM